MKPRLVFGLVAALVLLSFVAILSDRAEQSRRRSRLRGGPLLNGFSVEAVSRIDIKKAGDWWRVANVSNVWHAWHLSHSGGGSEDYLADVDAVQGALKQLAALDRSSLASSKPAKHSSLAVDENNSDSTLVEIWTGDDAPAYRLIVGATPPDHGSNFVRLANEDSVFSSKRPLGGVFDRGQTGWRERAIIRVAAQDVVHLQLTNGDQIVTLRRPGKNVVKREWLIVEPEEAKADGDTIDSILRNLTTLATDDFPEDTDPATTGLPLATERCRITTEDGRSVEIAWGNEVNSKAFVQKVDDDTVFAVFSYKKSAIQKRLDQLKAKVPAGGLAAPADATPQ